MTSPEASPSGAVDPVPRRPPTPASATGPVCHLYVHLPFCRARCPYCDFASEALGPHDRAGRVAAYVDALLTEWTQIRYLLERPLATVYVGGGTPTALAPQLLGRLFDQLGPWVDARTEVTVEANPESIDPPLLALLDASGVTRLSIGVQSFQPALLSALGRKTPESAARRALAVVRQGGWKDWSIDLMYGVPGQDRAALEADLDAAVAARPPHVSVYDLTYTDRYARRVGSRLGPAARGAAEAWAEEHFHLIRERLLLAGYERYEVSNYCLPGHVSRHNQAYWRGKDYVGIGASAVSTVGGRRWANPPTVAAYLAGERPDVEVLSRDVRRFERVMLGLRTSEGVPEDEARPALEPEALERCLAGGLVERAYATLRLSPRGLDLSNAVLAAILRLPEDTPPAADEPSPARSG